MDIKISCPNCGQHILVDSTAVGQQAACPTCSKPFTIAAAPPAVAPGPPRPPIPQKAAAPRKGRLALWLAVASSVGVIAAAVGIWSFTGSKNRQASPTTPTVGNTDIPAPSHSSSSDSISKFPVTLSVSPKVTDISFAPRGIGFNGEGMWQTPMFPLYYSKNAYLETNAVLVLDLDVNDDNGKMQRLSLSSDQSLSEEKGTIICRYMDPYGNRHYSGKGTLKLHFQDKATNRQISNTLTISLEAFDEVSEVWWKRMENEYGITTSDSAVSAKAAVVADQENNPADPNPEQLRKLLSRLGTIISVPTDLVKNGTTDMQLMHQMFDPDSKLSKIYWEKLGIATPAKPASPDVTSNSAIRLPEVAAEIDALTLRPNSIDAIPDRTIPLDDVRRILGPHFTIQTESYFTSAGLGTAPPSNQNFTWFRYGRWSFGGITNANLLAVRIYFPDSPKPPLMFTVKSVETKQFYKSGAEPGSITVTAKRGFKLLFVAFTVTNLAEAGQKFSSQRFRVLDKNGKQVKADFVGLGDSIAGSTVSLSVEGTVGEKASYKGELSTSGSFVEWNLAARQDYSDTLVFVVPQTAEGFRIFLSDSSSAQLGQPEQKSKSDKVPIEQINHPKVETAAKNKDSIEKELNPILHFALDTLSGEHSLSDAVQALNNNASTNKQLTAQLQELSKCEDDGVRNLALWCLEVAFPDDKAVWKRIIRDGNILTKSAIEHKTDFFVFLANHGQLKENAGTDWHGFENTPIPAMKLADFLKLYGQPDRKVMLEQVGVKPGEESAKRMSHQWFFYGPIGVKVDDAKSSVLSGEISMSTILWASACKAFKKDLSWNCINAVPDINSIFLKVAETPP